MKLKKVLLIFIAIIIALFVFNNKCNAGYQEWNSLDYDVQLNEDGSMDITETWDIDVSDTNTLFKEFNKGANITNVSVQEVLSNGQIKEFTKIDTYMYHVTKDCYYGLKNSNNNFEIAWGVSISNSATKTYKIKYKVLNTVTTYNDCNEFYWQFLSDDNEIKATVVTGTIKLPQEVSNIDNLKVWAHGPLNGVINRENNKTVKFSINNLKEETMLEVRVVTTENLFNDNTNIKNTSKLSSILSEEEEWAEEANKQRERAKTIEMIMNIIMIIIALIVGIVIPVWAIYLIVKYSKHLKSIKEMKPETEIEYFRDIPDEDATPAGVGFLYYLNKLEANVSNVYTATLLDLCLKKYIEFKIEKNSKNKEEISIILIDREDINLNKSEKIVYNMLTKIATDNCVTMKMLQKYATDHYTIFLSSINQISKAGKEEQIEKQNYDEVGQANKRKWRNKGIGFIVVAIYAGIFGLGFFLSDISFIIKAILILNIILIFVNGIMCIKISKKYSVLTQKGINEKSKWLGLENYMLNFSLLNEKEVPELVIWEKYLVYATVFGIADTVLEQLKIKYPQLEDESYMIDNGYAYIYLLNRNHMGNQFMHSLNASVHKAYDNGRNASYAAASSSYSSSGGGGGGFSGGGGGRRWRRTLRRKIELKI